MYNKLVNNVINVNTNQVSCKGNEYPYDHPLIYLKINKNEKNVICPYCSNKFRLAKQ